MATLTFYPSLLKTLRYRVASSWHNIKNGVYNPEFDIPGVNTLEQTAEIRIETNGVHSGEPNQLKFLSNSRVGITFNTSTLWGNSNIKNVKFGIKVQTVNSEDEYQTSFITPDLNLVRFVPTNRDNFLASEYANQFWKSNNVFSFISEDTIHNSNIVEGASLEWNINDFSIVSKKNSPSPFTTFGLVNNYDTLGTPQWVEDAFKSYVFYDENSSTLNRPYLEVEYEESKYHFFNFTEEEEMPVDVPGGSAGDEHWDNVSTLINGSETIVGSDFTEKSDEGHTVTIETGVTQTTGSGGKFGEGYTFGSYASEHYMTMPDHDDFNFAGGNFTIEFWIKLTATPTSYACVFSHGNADQQEHVLQMGNWDSPNGFNLDWFARGGLSSNMAVLGTSGDNQTGPVTVGDWHHVALVRDGNVFSMYLNGNFRKSDTKTGSIQNYTNDFHIGKGARRDSGSFEGILDDFRITKGIARYTGTVQTDWGNFSEIDTEWGTQSGSSGGSGDTSGDPHWDLVTNYMRFNSDLKDESETGGDVEVLGTYRINTETKMFGEGSLQFYSNAYDLRGGIRLYGDSVNFKEDNFAIELFFRVDEVLSSIDNKVYYLMDFRSISNLPNTFPEYIYIKNQNLYYKEKNGIDKLLKSSMYDTEWHHFAFTRHILGDNIILNPGFEFWYLGDINDWIEVGSPELSNEITIVRNKDSLHSLKMISSTDEGVKNTTSITTVTGKRYYLSYYIYTIDATEIETKVSNGSTVFANSTTPLSLETWELVEMEFDADNATTYVHILSSDDDKTFYIDDINLQLKDENYRMFFDGVESESGSIQTIPEFYNFKGEEVWINSQVDNEYNSSVYNTQSKGLLISIDDFRITNGHYRYGSGFSIPTSEHHNYESPKLVGDPYWTETSLLLHYDQSSIYDKSQNTKVVGSIGQPNIITDDPQVSGKEFQMGVGALYLDGDDDYLFVEHHSDFIVDTQDFTAEAFIKINSFKNETMWIFGFDGTEVESSDWRLGITSTKFLLFEDMVDDETYFVNEVLLEDTWYSVAVVRESTGGSANLSLYINGIRKQQDIGIPKSAFSGVASNRFIGHSNNDIENGNFYGTIDELRITVGQARYTDATYVYDDLIPYEEIQQYNKYENPYNSIQTEENSFVAKHYEYLELPFNQNVVQFSNEFSLLPDLTTGALLHNTGEKDSSGWVDDWFDKYNSNDPTPGGLQNNKPRGDLFQYIDGNVVYAEHWLETEEDQTLNVVDDLISSEVLEEDSELDLNTSTIPIGGLLTHLVVGEQKFFSVVSDYFKLTSEIANRDPFDINDVQYLYDSSVVKNENYTYFPYDQYFNFLPEFIYEEFGLEEFFELSGIVNSIGTINEVYKSTTNGYTIGQSEKFRTPTSKRFDNSYYFGNIIFDDKLQRTIIDEGEGKLQKISKHSLDILPGLIETEFKFPPYPLNNIAPRDNFNFKDITFLNGLSIVLQENYLYTNYNDIGNGKIVSNNIDFGSFVFDERIQRTIIDEGEGKLQKISRYVNNLLPGLDERFSTSILMDNVKARDYFTRSENYFVGEFNPVIQENYSYTYYNEIDPGKFVSNEIDFGDIILDERMNKTIINTEELGSQIIKRYKQEHLSVTKDDFKIESKRLWENVIGNFFNQYFQFSSDFKVVPDTTFEPQYGELFSDFKAVGLWVNDINLFVEDDEFDIFKINGDNTSSKLATFKVQAVNPSSDTEQDNEWSNVSMLLPFNSNYNNIATQSAINFQTANGLDEYLTYDSLNIYNSTLTHKPDGWGVSSVLKVAKWQDESDSSQQGFTLSSNITATGKITIDWWMWRDPEWLPETPSQEFVFINGTPGDSNDVEGLSTRSDNSNSYGTYDWRYFNDSSIFGWSDINDTDWHHWAFVRDDSNNIKFYRDGIEVASGSKTGDIVISRILCGFYAYFKNFRITNNVSRWTSNFDDELYDLKGEWSEVNNNGTYEGWITRYSSDAKLSMNATYNPIQLTSEGFSELKTGTSTSGTGNTLSGYLSWEFDRNSVDNDNRWQFGFGSSPITVFDEEAGGTKEIKSLVHVYDDFELQTDVFNESVLRFYNYIQVFGDTLVEEGYNLGGSPLNIITIDGNDVLLQEEQSERYDFEFTSDVNKFSSSLIEPSIVGYDNLTQENFQFINGGTNHIVDSRLISPLTQNSFQHVNNFGSIPIVDSGRYNDVTLDSTTFLPDYTDPLHFIEDGVRKITIDSTTSDFDNYYPTNASNEVLHLDTNYKTSGHEFFGYADKDVFYFPTLEQHGLDGIKLTKLDHFSKDNFQFINQSNNAILDGGFINSAVTTNGNNGNDLDDYPQLKDFISGRIVLDEKHVNSYDVNGEKNDLLQTIGHETMSLDETEFAFPADLNNIVARDYWGGDFLQLVDGRFVPTIEAVQFLDVGSDLSSNAFLNLLSNTTTEVEFEYNSELQQLKVTFSSNSPSMWSNYIVNREVWVGRFISEENTPGLKLLSNKFWTITDSVEDGNYIILYVPLSDIEILNPSLPGVPTADGTILMSSMNMTALQVYFNNL